MNIAETLREACKASGLTQQQLASQYGIPLRTLEAWIGDKRTPPDYVVNLLLRCLAVDFPAEPVLSEQPETVTSTAEPVKKPTYTLHHSYGKRLTDKEAAYVEQEIANGRTVLVSENEQNPGRKQYMCESDGFIFELRPVKEEV